MLSLGFSALFQKQHVNRKIFTTVGSNQNYCDSTLRLLQDPYTKRKIVFAIWMEKQESLTLITSDETG